ncbi:hypothetical protein BH10PSE19_BH10PSE19_22260 [soil metagenome]
MRIILGLGPSSVGKTSLSNELIRQTESKDDSWRIVSGDVVVSNRFIATQKAVKTKLRSEGLFGKLAGFCSEEEVVNLCDNGVLSISKGRRLLAEHPFPDPTLPGLEDILTEAKFDKGEVDSLSVDIRRVAQIGKEICDAPLYSMVNMIYTDVFQEYDPKATVFIDIVPDIVPFPGESVRDTVEEFDRRMAVFRKQHPDKPIEIIKIGIYCPIRDHSERIKERNRKAATEEDPAEARIGTFPFEHASKMLTAVDSDTKEDKAPGSVWVCKLTRDALYDIAINHYCPMPGESDEKTAKVDLTVNDDGGVNFNIRLGVKGTSEEYGSLLDKFGMLGSHRREVDLYINRDGLFDMTINMVTGTPKELAEKLIADVAKFKPVVGAAPRVFTI